VEHKQQQINLWYINFQQSNPADLVSPLCSGDPAAGDRRRYFLLKRHILNNCLWQLQAKLRFA
jgi:hypothetical protein